jgi:uncharacterized SAM-binding protein YcdF (DUF218 family)
VHSGDGPAGSEIRNIIIRTEDVGRLFMSYLEPAYPLLLLVAVAGLIRSWRRSTKNDRPWLLAFSIVGLVLISSTPVSWIFSRPLEVWYDQDPIPKGTAEAIVVLAGSVDPPRPKRPYALSAHDTYERVQHAAWLFNNWKSIPVVVCGGGQDGESYSKTMRHLLESEGVPSNLIWTESRSRSTYENALYSSEILRQHHISRIALVTDARSMPRAVAAFTKQGISVVPAPIRFYNLEFSLEDVLPTWRAIQTNGETAHEFAGLVWYWLRGWI